MNNLVPVYCLNAFHPSTLFFAAYGSRANCEEYMKALYVDPILEVSPGVVVAETLTQFILHPLEGMGSKLAKFQGAIVSKYYLFCPLKNLEKSTYCILIQLNRIHIPGIIF